MRRTRVGGCRLNMGEVGAGKDNERGPGESCPRPSLPFFPFSNYSFPITHHCRQTVDVEDERVDGGGVRMREVGAGKDNKRALG